MSVKLLKLVHVLFATMLSMGVCDYELRLRVHSYSNPQSRCAECTNALFSSVHTCCDNSFNTGVCRGDELCDTFFRYCFGQGEPCAEKINTLFTFDNTDVLQNIGDTIFGTPNPLILSGNIWKGAQFYLEPYDRDSSALSQLIDTFTVDVNIEGGQKLKPQMYRGTFGLAETELSFELVCNGSYSLPDCTACEPGSSPLCINRQEAVTATEAPDVPDPPSTVTRTAEPTNATIAESPVDTKIFRYIAIALATVSFVAVLSILVLLVLLLIKKKKKGRGAHVMEDVPESTTTIERQEVLRDRIQLSSNQAYTTVNNLRSQPTSTTLMPSTCTTTVHMTAHPSDHSEYIYDYIDL